MQLLPAVRSTTAALVALACLTGCGGAPQFSDDLSSEQVADAAVPTSAVDATDVGDAGQIGPSDADGASLTGLVVALQTFDAKCDGVDATYNCRAAFQSAFAAIDKAGGGTLQLPAGTFLIAAPEVPIDVTSAPALTRSSLVVVPPNTTLLGTLAANGSYASTIRWTSSSIPLLIFDRADKSSIRQVHIQYAGVLPANVNGYPYGDIALLKGLGYQPTFAHNNQMQGTASEVFSAVYVFNSNHCTFDHLLFDSATRDNDHIYGFGINLKGAGVVTAGGNGGLSALATGNQLTNLEFHDDDMAMLVSGQDHLVVKGITADDRGSSTAFGPGHVLYLSGQYTFHADGTSTPFYNTNVTVANITEGPNILGNTVNSATLAPKFLVGATFDKIVSQHPAGIIATIYADQNVTFSNMSWSTTEGFCEETPTPELCGNAVINSTVSPAGLHPTQNLTFTGLTLSSTKDPITAGFIGDNLSLTDVSITSPAQARAGQTNAGAVLGIASTAKATITDYTYTPLLSAYSASTLYNLPFFGWGNAVSNATASVQIDWPTAIPVPPSSANAIRVGYQFPTASDVATAKVVVTP